MSARLVAGLSVAMLLPLGGGPAARSNPALIQDDAWGGMRLIYGLTEAGYTADLWSLDLGGDALGWVESSPGAIAPAPCARHDAALRDGASDLLGGFGNDGALADFWRLKGAGGASS